MYYTHGLTWSESVALVGETWTGKSNLFLRITQNKFNPDTFGTIGASYAVQRVISVHDELIKGAGGIVRVLFCQLYITGELWDISGRSTYWDVASSSLR